MATALMLAELPSGSCPGSCKAARLTDQRRKQHKIIRDKPLLSPFEVSQSRINLDPERNYHYFSGSNNGLPRWEVRIALDQIPQREGEWPAYFLGGVKRLVAQIPGHTHFKEPG